MLDFYQSCTKSATLRIMEIVKAKTCKKRFFSLCLHFNLTPNLIN